MITSAPDDIRMVGRISRRVHSAFAYRMKYSLKTLAVFFLIAGLRLALIIAGIRVRQLEAEKEMRQETLGFSDASQSGDRYHLKAFGFDKHGSDGSIKHVPKFYLLRVENHRNYQLETTIYDGVTKTSSHEYTNFTGELVALTV